MTSTFKVGDIVCYKAQFLRDIGLYTDVPINGKVLDVETDQGTVRVHWCDSANATRVRSSNLILYSERHLEAA